MSVISLSVPSCREQREKEKDNESSHGPRKEVVLLSKLWAEKLDKSRSCSVCVKCTKEGLRQKRLLGQELSRVRMGWSTIPSSNQLLSVNLAAGLFIRKQIARRRERLIHPSSWTQGPEKEDKKMADTRCSSISLRSKSKHTKCEAAAEVEEDFVRADIRDAFQMADSGPWPLREGPQKGLQMRWAALSSCQY